MKNKKKKSSILSLVLMGSLVLGACSNEKTAVEKKDSKKEPTIANFNQTGMPIVKDKIELKGFAGKFLQSQDWNNLMLWQEYEKMTNIHINWDTVQTQSLKEKRNLMLASGEYPDVLFAAAVPKTDLVKFGQQGVFIPLNDLIDKYAPNFKKIMEKYPIVKKGITMPDGKIYGFPTFYDPEFKGLLYGTPWIKKDWLDKLGLKEPTTLDEFESVLQAIKDGDPNGNGKADEIPWGGAYGIDDFIYALKGSFGLNNHGIANNNVDLDPKTKKMRFVPTTDGYKELLQYLNKLYTKGLIDKEIFTLKTEEFSAKASKNTFGVINGVDPGTTENLSGFVGIPVLKGPHGDRLNTAIGSPLGNIGMAVITNKNKSPEATVRWIDHLYSDEGSKMFFMGFEGKTYTQDPKTGKLDYVDEIKKNPDGLTLDQAVSKYLTWPGGYYPGFVQQKYFNGAESKEATTANAKQAEPLSLKLGDVWPAFNFTAEEQSELTPISTDMDTYLKEMTANFITGKADFSKWNEYKSTLEKMGVKRYIEIYEAAYKRMEK
ncbi:extracellular solute-binding protein [Bacillus sp. FJAT-53711]|uniref:Extracellular solute-binding protein n=1 Tax=Bacillus yunxiaonensis TaxID=3127665 RepID=A0ABU8FUS8_9BACI